MFLRLMSILPLFVFSAMLCMAQMGMAQPVDRVALTTDSLVQSSPAVLQSADSLLLPPDVPSHQTDTVLLGHQDSLVVTQGDSLVELRVLEADTLMLRMSGEPLPSIDKSHWLPNPKKSLWLAIVFPGGGQIYNRKYWKLPLFYGGFIGCAYAINWNNTMYSDYSQAYIDIMDDDPNTKSYESFIPRTYNIEANLERLQELFRKKKDFYRRYRDLSIFCVIGVYALSIIDAYVDAELSSFDISHDLSMKVRPSVIHDHSTAWRGSPNPLHQAYGVQCSISF